MILPVRCFTCGKVIGDMWDYYERETKKLAEKNDFSGVVTVADLKAMFSTDKTTDKDPMLKNFDRTLRYEVFDKLGLDRICCRRHLLAHVDLIQDI